MRGAEALLRARLSGYQPTMVFVEVDLPDLPLGIDQIQIQASDRLSSLDLRCLYGLNVSVSGENGPRTRQIALAATQVGATRVIAYTSVKRVGGEFEVVEVFDSEGIATWKA